MSAVTKAVFHTTLAGGDRARIMVEWRKHLIGFSAAPGYVVLEDSEDRAGAFVVSEHLTRQGAMRKALALWYQHEENADAEAEEYVARCKAEYLASVAAKGGAS